MCLAIAVAVWYWLKFGRELLFQLLGWFGFLFFRADAEDERERWKGKF